MNPSLDELQRRFSALEHSARILREQITAEIFALADTLARSDAPRSDDFCTGCIAIQKQLGQLNSFLLGAQLALRMGQQIKNPNEGHPPSVARCPSGKI